MSLSAVTLTGATTSDDGVAIRVNDGGLRVDQSTVTGNASGGQGGAIHLGNGTAAIQGS